MNDDQLTLTKAGDRYYVFVEGVRVGWVMKWADNDGWSFYSPVRDALQAQRLAAGERTRRDALIEGLATLRIRHLGRIFRLSHETWTDEPVFVGRDALRKVWDRLMDEKYPEPAR